MASIKDFFSAGTVIETVRVTHNTSGQCYNLNCGSWQCFCLPSTATTWTVEAWGQGGGGGGSCCCQWGCEGGAGSDYAYSDWASWSCGSGQMWCNCTCMCFCCSPAQSGHPGQFSRMSNCTASYDGCVGGGIYGYTCCFYGSTSYFGKVNEQYNPYAVVASGTGSATEITGLVNIDCDCWNACCTSPGNPYSEWSGGSGGGAGGVDNWYDPTTACTYGFFDGDSNSNTHLSRRGSCGWSDATVCEVGLIRGAGGSSYGGGFVQCKCSQPGNWAHTGCPGKAPGGGASSGAGCGGGCCCGGVGGMGAILMSWDN